MASTHERSALIIGEALIDIVNTGGAADASTAPSQREYPGGSPMNVAIGLGRLGRNTHLATWIGDDSRGDMIVAHLRDAGVSVDAQSTEAAYTSTATAHIDAEGSASYEFDLEWNPQEIALERSDLVVHTGSIAAVVEPGAERVLERLERAHDQCTITFDPNARPSIMKDPVQTLEMVERYIRLADVVKASDHDIDWLYQGKRSYRDVALDWLENFDSKLVVITRGGDGVDAFSAGGVEYHDDAPSVEVVDTVGAGDSFMAGIIDGLWTKRLLGAKKRHLLRDISGGDVAGVISHASQIAGITVSRPGANPPWLSEL
ncbi:MAG: carbohydrate kinase [Actinomycetaceae bacterium]|nr:carbohydrate kinase [Actinomycetaceae bacterium]